MKTANMRFKMLIKIMLVLIFTLFFVEGTEGQIEPNEPLYSVAYPVENGIGVTTFYNDHTLHTEVLEDALYDQVLNRYLAPLWSPDGRFLYGLRPSPLNPEDFMTWLHMYDVIEDTFTPVIDFPVPNADHYPGNTEIVDLSLSPDGHHIWASMPENSNTSYLLDLQTGSLASALDCPALVSFWLRDQAIVLPYYCSYIGPQFIDLATGAVQTTTEDFEWVFAHYAVTLDNDEVWFWKTSNLDDEGFAINVHTMEQIPYLVGSVWTTPDGSLAALKSREGHLLRSNGDPHQIVDTGAIGEITSHFEQVGIIHFWHYVVLDNEQYEITYTSLTSNSRTDTLVYQGDFPNSWSSIDFSPYGPYLTVDDGSTTQLYSASGYPEWSSEASTYSILWSQDNEWLFFSGYNTPRAVALNLQTGEVVELPLEGSYQIMGASPDGEWWILMHGEEDNQQALAFHIPTETITDLMNEFPLHERKPYTWYGDPELMHQLFLWSPVITTP